ncbi:signal peptidase I [Tuanshanicoccus lijuaniae]|uniref:signal peptidase I n=1 Tax=Aerococcaceae bacterium zg-1292 TaxID=2774330 RepID=UPI001BD8E9F9|nr:signal peptidase I [Aerococcaceae bacterium zg-A91]MBS4458710.1 signal peptidase I [Aerococcaceae bacterium zg-BR33]
MDSLKSLFKSIADILFSVTLAVIIFMGVKQYVVQPFQVEGHSMDLTLTDGRQMLLNKVSAIQRFDIVIFPDPTGLTTNHYVKRLIGLPGDTLAVHNEQLILNSVTLAEPYLEPLKSQTAGVFTENFSLWDTIGSTTIPDGFYFVMGDNRPHSGDSRQFGLVPIESVQGVAEWTYFPLEAIGSVKRYQLSNDGTQIVEK